MTLSNAPYREIVTVYVEAVYVFGVIIRRDVELNGCWSHRYNHTTDLLGLRERKVHILTLLQAYDLGCEPISREHLTDPEIRFSI